MHCGAFGVGSKLRAILHCRLCDIEAQLKKFPMNARGSPKRIFLAQPSLRAKWKEVRAGRPDDIRGLAVDEYVALLRDRLLPLIERFHHLTRESVEALGRMRQAPSLQVEQAQAIKVVLA